MYTCHKCKMVHEFDEVSGIEPNVYEYRGAYACEECFDDVIAMRDSERNRVMSIEHNKTKVFKGLDMTDSVIGKANNELLKRHKEVASKESNQLKAYENR